tara:strand:+ start:1200 stop:1514 length:315 start_codon:yes stop_codon:yes gene_type:complete
MRKLLLTMVVFLLVGGAIAQVGVPSEKIDQKENKTKSECSYEQNTAGDKGVEKTCCKKGKDSSARSPWWSIFKKEKKCDRQYSEKEKGCNLEGKDKQKGCCKKA